jgi:hypothetical protein
VRAAHTVGDCEAQPLPLRLLLGEGELEGHSVELTVALRRRLVLRVCVTDLLWEGLVDAVTAGLLLPETVEQPLPELVLLGVGLEEAQVEPEKLPEALPPKREGEERALCVALLQVVPVKVGHLVMLTDTVEDTVDSRVVGTPLLVTLTEGLVDLLRVSVTQAEALRVCLPVAEPHMELLRLTEVDLVRVRVGVTLLDTLPERLADTHLEGLRLTVGERLCDGLLEEEEALLTLRVTDTHTVLLRLRVGLAVPQPLPEGEARAVVALGEPVGEAKAVVAMGVSVPVPQRPVEEGLSEGAGEGVSAAARVSRPARAPSRCTGREAEECPGRGSSTRGASASRERRAGEEAARERAAAAAGCQG